MDLKLQEAPPRLNPDLHVDVNLQPEDLAILESRIEEIERYLGIQDMDLDYFLKE